MTDDRSRHRRVRELFHLASERPPHERARFLEQSCGEHSALRREVEALLAAAEVPTDLVLPTSPVKRRSSAAGMRITGARSWRLLRELGRGGMGTVYLAERSDGDFRQQGALKLIRDDRLSPELLRRFAEERRILAGLSHPNVARLLDGGTAEDGSPFLVMERVEGERLDVYCDRRRLDVDARLDLFRTVCAAVHAAHQHLVVHRDLKPSNVLVTADGVVKLVDFGIACLLAGEVEDAPPEPRASAGESTRRMMTPVFASPEQVRGAEVTTATDVYSLGVVLYVLLSGRRPYRLDGLPLEEVRRIVCELRPPPPSAAVTAPSGGGQAGDVAELAEARSSTPQRLARRLSGDLDAIVERAMAKRPEERYASAADLAADLHRHLRGLPVSARPPTFAYRAGKLLARHRLPAAAIAALVALGVALAAQTWLQARRAEAQRDRAQRVVASLVEMFDTLDPIEAQGDGSLARTVLPQGRAMVEEQLEEHPSLGVELALAVGRLYRSAGLYGDSEMLLTAALAVARRERSPPARIAEILAERGLTHLKLGLAGEARGDLEAALAGLPPSRESAAARADVLNGLGLAERELGDLDASGRRLAEAEAACRLAGGPPRTRAKILDNRAQLAVARGEAAEAEGLQRQALELLRTALPAGHPDVAEGLNNLGSVLLWLGRYDEAEVVLREAIEHVRAHLGEDHPHLAMAYSNLAEAPLKRGNLAEAERLNLRSLEILRRTLGESHVSTAISLNNLAMLQHEQGHREEAITTLQEAIAVFESALGTEHTNVANAHTNLGSVLLQSHRLEEAERHLETAERIHRSLAPAPPGLAYTLQHRGMVRYLQGRPEDALELFHQALTLRREIHGSTSLEVAESLFAIGKVLLERGEPEAAEPHLAEAASIRETVLPAEHLALAEARAALAEARGGAPPP